MFDLINFILLIIILVRIFRYDKFYYITQDFHVREYKNNKKEGSNAK